MLNEPGERDEQSTVFVNPQPPIAFLDAEEVIAGGVLDMNAGADRHIAQARPVTHSPFTFFPPFNSEFIGRGRQQIEQLARRFPMMRTFGFTLDLVAKAVVPGVVRVRFLVGMNHIRFIFQTAVDGGIEG